MAIYVIQPGDSLFKLAQRFGTTPQALAQANGIVNPGQILVGQRLNVPEWSGQSGFQGAKSYTVQPGDSLFTIGRRFGVTPHAIAQASGLSMNGYIYPGQTLQIPSPGAGPAPAPVPSASPISVPLSNVADTQFSFQQLWPHIQQASARYGADAKVVAAIVAQESTFKNHRVHRDGTGHGLIGLDDNGRLPDFEKWSGQKFGRGRGAKSIPPGLQIEYLAKAIAEMSERYQGNAYAAAREWHRGHPSVIWDAKGARYEGYIRGHVRELFG